MMIGIAHPTAETFHDAHHASYERSAFAEFGVHNADSLSREMLGRDQIDPVVSYQELLCDQDMKEYVNKLHKSLDHLVDIVPENDRAALRLPALVWHLAHLACACDRAVRIRNIDELIERAQSRDSVLGDLLRRYMLSVSMSVEPTNVRDDRSEGHARERVKEALQSLREVFIRKGSHAVWLVLRTGQMALNAGIDSHHAIPQPVNLLPNSQNGTHDDSAYYIQSQLGSPVTSDDEFDDGDEESEDDLQSSMDGFTQSPPRSPGFSYKRQIRSSAYDLDDEVLAELRNTAAKVVQNGEGANRKRRRVDSPKKQQNQNKKSYMSCNTITPVMPDPLNIATSAITAERSPEYRLPPPPKVPANSGQTANDWRALVNHISIQLEEAQTFDEVRPSGLFFLGRIDKSKCSGKRKPAIHAAVSVVVPNEYGMSAVDLESRGEFALLAHTTEHKQGGRLRDKVEKAVRNSKGPIMEATEHQEVLSGGPCIGLLDWGKDHEIGRVYVTSTGHLSMNRGPACEDGAGGYLCLPLGAHFDVGHFRRPTGNDKSRSSRSPANENGADDRAAGDSVEFSYVHALSCNESVLETRVAPWMVECFELRISYETEDGRLLLGRAVFQAYSLKVARLKAKQFICH